MRLKTRLSKLEERSPRITRAVPLRNGLNGKPELVAVVGGGLFDRAEYSSDTAFQTAIYACEAEAWESDPDNLDPIQSLFDAVAKRGLRLGGQRNGGSKGANND